MWRLFIICSAIVRADRRAHGSELDHNPVVISPFGEFRGIFNVTRLGRRYEAYRGIKYAEPPVGDLRFRPPVDIINYTLPVDATRDGPACPQPATPGFFVDEDCLTVNVYTPLRTERKSSLPVIVYIHAGGFYSMTGRSDLAGPDYLLDRDVVLVTMNYRLATLGFLSMGNELAPGNNGLKDQVSALRWVRRNVNAFGGDPARVTLAGCSAGAKSVMLHMVSPMSKGLFHRAISLSGAPTGKCRNPTHLLALARRQAELARCPIDSPERIYDCLKTVPWRTLATSLKQFYQFGYDPLILWEPVVEPDYGQERFLPVDPVDAIKQGLVHDVPYIISRTEDEFFWKAFTILRNETLLTQMNEQWDRIAPISFALQCRGAGCAEGAGGAAGRRLRVAYRLQQLRNDSSTAHNLGRLYADAIESFNIYRLTKLMSVHSRAPVWASQFSYIGDRSHYEDPQTKKPTGVAHHDDLMYVLYLAYRFPRRAPTGRDADIVDKMTAIWYNFARYGDPNDRGDTPELDTVWPAVTAREKPYLRIDTQLSVGHDLFQDGAQIWEELYPMEY